MEINFSNWESFLECALVAHNVSLIIRKYSNTNFAQGVDLDALKSVQKEKDRLEDEKRRQEYLAKMPENLGSIEVIKLIYSGRISTSRQKSS